jgi:hypothetical protein
MDGIIGLLIILALPGYFVLQLRMAWRYRGGWLIAALVPLAAMAPLIIYSGVALSDGANLWPLLLILSAPFAFVYLLIVGAARALRAG